MRTWLLAGIALLPSAVHAATAAPSVTAWGFDDNNFSTLVPYLAPYMVRCPWLASSLPNSANQDNVGWGFNDPAQWSFRFAADVPGQSSLDASVVDPFYYTAWVVNNDPYALPNGTQATPVAATGDVGGANFTMNYTPGPTDPGGVSSGVPLANVHFFQFVRTITTFGNALEQPVNTVTRYFIDNNGNLTKPFYDQNFAFGYAGVNLDQKWMDDTPFRCENQSGNSPTCRSDGVPNILNIDWEAQVFVAVDLGANATLPTATQHDVILYGGRWWGYVYSNDDAPEPALGLLSGAALLGMVALRGRISRR